MRLVFNRRLAIPLWALGFLAVALTAPDAPALMMPPATGFVPLTCSRPAA
jgi:hypothetical protein